MNIKTWLDKETPNLSQCLAAINCQHLPAHAISPAGRNKVLQIVQCLRCSLFPGVFEEGDSPQPAGRCLNRVAYELYELLQDILPEDRQKQAREITTGFISSLPAILELLIKDIQAAYAGDPAADSLEDVLLSYPSITAIMIHRLAHHLYRQEVPLIPRIMNEYAHQNTGIDIHPGAQIGESFFIDHGTGVVIGGTTTIGNQVKLYQGVTLGALSFDLDAEGNPVKGGKRHPDIEDGVIIYSGATILGGETRIGHHSVIGGNVWLTHSVPPHSRVYNAQPEPMIKIKDNEKT
ncbi:MAG: serine acetyltransferase [Clostridiales bacterium]|nr:serine acetyltransferase [Clostridiales bacterium]